MKKITKNSPKTLSRIHNTQTHDHEIKHRKQYEVIIIES